MENTCQLPAADQHPGSQAVLFVSIGDRSRESSCAAAAAAARLLPDYEMRKVFVNRRQDPENQRIKDACSQAAADGIHTLIVQPLYLMHGAEYNNLAGVLEQCRQKFAQLVLGAPLLTDDADFAAVLAAAVRRTAAYDEPKTAVCFAGHGTDTAAEAVYRKMRRMLAQAGYGNYYLGTIKAGPSAEDVVNALRADGGFERVVLYPFMTAAGSHVYRDLAGDQDGSWKRVLEQAGYEVVCVLEGLGQIPAVQEVFAAHVKAAAVQLQSPGG